MGKAFFVTGTDTEVGKTLVTSAFLHAGARQGLRTLGMKPLAAGSEENPEYAAEVRVNEDAVSLMEYSSVKLPYQQVNPVLLDEAIAPHIAASKAGKRLTANRLSGFCRGLKMQPSDLMLVEGAGGWHVPLNPRETLANVARDLQMPVILVVGMRLGCLNHALLTAQAIRNDGLPIAGWVANCMGDMPELEANIQTLEQMLPAPRLATVPNLKNLSDKVDMDIVADHLNEGLNYLLNKL